LIERFAGRIAGQLTGAEPRLLLDGGDAITLLPLLDVPAELAADSVLRGLLVWADSHPVPASP
jgi:type III pantothenate kinase